MTFANTTWGDVALAAAAFVAVAWFAWADVIKRWWR